MPEKFEPIKVVDTGEKTKEFKVDFSEQSMGDLGKEHFRLKNYLDQQSDKIQKHLDAFKKGAMKEYTGTFKWNNEKAVNQAMEDYAKEMNQILEQSTQELLEIANKYGDLLGDNMSSDSIDQHYKKVAEEFGPVLEKRILDQANSRVDAVIKAAEGRSKNPPAEYANPFDINARRADKIK